MKNTTNKKNMPKLRTVRENILLAASNNIIDYEECILLYDINSTKNPDIPYWSYAKFDLESMSDDESKSEFRFQRRDIYRLADVFNMPEEILCYNGLRVDSTEALCILLKRFAYPCRLLDLIPRFARPVPQLSMIAAKVMSYLYENWRQLLSSFNQPWLSANSLEEYANAVHLKGAPLQNCWGFIDGTVRPICRPGTNQRVLYNGHKKVHAIKFQSVVAPNGLIANLFGPVEGRKHDSGMLADSNLLNHLNQHSFDTNGNPLCIYGDPAYPLRVHLQAGFKGANRTPQENLWNKQMSEVRTAVEWVFGDIINYFKFLDFKKNLKIGLSAVAKMYIVCALLHNARTCLYGSTTSLYFGLDPPLIEEYFG